MARVALIGGFGDLVLAFRGPLIADLRAAGHDVTVSVPEPDPALRTRIAEGLAERGARWIVSPLDRTGTNPLRERAARRHFDRLFRDERFDAVLAYNPKPIYYAVPSARAAGVPTVAAMVTGLGFAFSRAGLRARILGTIARHLYRRALVDADVVFFQNPDDRAAFESGRLLRVVDGRPKVVMVPGSGVDTRHFSFAPVPEGPPIFLMIARLLKDKGVREFAEAAAIVRAERPEARFRLVGWIDTNPAAITQAELDAWVRSGAIEFAGRLADVRPELVACSAFVLPSYREGTPKSALEALATGRAIVTTDAPGCRSTVAAGENGLLVPPGDAKALATACLRLCREPGSFSRFGLRSRALAETIFESRLVNRTVIEALGL